MSVVRVVLQVIATLALVALVINAAASWEWHHCARAHKSRVHRGRRR